MAFFARTNQIKIIYLYFVMITRVPLLKKSNLQKNSSSVVHQHRNFSARKHRRQRQKAQPNIVIDDFSRVLRGFSLVFDVFLGLALPYSSILPKITAPLFFTTKIFQKMLKLNNKILKRRMFWTRLTISHQ
jgi:hypothetical protein